MRKMTYFPLITAAILALGACTPGEAWQNTRAVAQRYVEQTKRTLDTRERLHAHEMALIEEWCDFLSDQAKLKKELIFGTETLRAALLAMVDGNQALAVDLLSEEKEVDQQEVARVYKAAIECYRDRPPVLRLEEYKRSLNKGAKPVTGAPGNVILRGPEGKG